MNATNSSAAPQPRSKASTFIAILAIVAVACVFYYLDSPAPSGDSGTKAAAVGKKMPFLALDPLTGDSKKVEFADFAGHVTVLNFWGTWCPPCRREFPHIVELADKLAKNDAFRLYAVSCGGDARENVDELRDETQRFLEAFKTKLPTYTDPGGETRRSLIAGLGLEGFGYPTTLVIDGDNVVRGLWVGYQPGTEREIEELVEKLLKQGSEAT